MKLSAKTLQVLKNFSLINPGIVIKKGSLLSTIAPQKTILAKAEIEEEFEREFAIHDLSKFLGVMSFMDTPEIKFHNDTLTIEEGKTKVTFRYGTSSLIAQPPDKQINMSSDVIFDLQPGDFNNILKAQGSMGLPEIAVSGDDGGVYLSALDSKHMSGDSFSIQIGESNGHNFRFVFVPSNLKFINTSYRVTISKQGLMYLKGDNLEYWVPAESNHSFK